MLGHSLYVLVPPLRSGQKYSRIIVGDEPGNGLLESSGEGAGRRLDSTVSAPLAKAGKAG